MYKIELEQKQINEYIETSLDYLKVSKVDIENARYHHNSDYCMAPSIIKYGILSLDELNKKGIKKCSPGFLSLMCDTDSHTNGTNSVSLSVAGLTDLYNDEHEYNPFREDMVDFLITSNIQAIRTATHYGNEYITNKVDPKEIKSIDIRLLKYIELLNKENLVDVKNMIDKYNYLIEMAVVLRWRCLNIPIREMSENQNILLDVDKLSQSPKILLKKK